MMRKLLIVLGLVACVALVPSLTRVSAAGTTTIRMAYLAPTGSSWDKVYRAWANTVKEKTGGAVQVQMFPGGIAGDERDVIRKMKLGQLDAASLTSIGFGQIARPTIILQMPGIFENYDELVKTREKLNPEFTSMFQKEGYRMIGWADAGFGRVLSKKAILRPSDYKSVRPWMPREDPAMPEILKIIGANGVALGIPEVFPALQTGMVDTVVASAVAAVALQWFRYVTHMSTYSNIAIVGASLVREDVLKNVAPEHQKTMVETSKRAHEMLRAQVIKEDQAAYKTLIGRGIIEFDPIATPDQKAEWQKLNDEVIKRLTGKIFPQELLDKVKAAAKS